MQQFLSFFENLNTFHRFLWVGICLSISFLLEEIWPLFHHDNKKVKHLGINLVFLVTSAIINAGFGVATLGIYKWLETSHFGLLNAIELPLIIEFIIAILALDFFAQYLVHRLEHKIPFMWRFHTVHHSDTHLDASSGTRHHPGNYIFREIFALLAIVITGAPLAFYLTYKIFTIFFAYFTHANINMPARLDRFISHVFVSPNMHKFHHHLERPWTDTNFGNMFSFWDRIFGTFFLDDPQKIVYGLDVVDNSRDEDLVYQMKLPFDKNLKTD